MKILKENAKSALSSLYFLLCNAILKLKKKEKKEKRLTKTYILR